MSSRIARLSDIISHYDILLCDVWGVLHNGQDPFVQADEALAEARRDGLGVVLITNSPRLNDSVGRQLDRIGVSSRAYDRIVTSGDVTRRLVSELAGPIYFLGPDRDKALVDGLGVDCVGPEDARAVVCTGFFDDEKETPEDYRALLETLAKRNLPFICANPDLVVERGHRLIPCAGAIAALYQSLGGVTRIAGKPHQPIYEAAMIEAHALRGPVDRRRVLAIGDGMPTDVKGAVEQDIDLLYVSAGIHGREYMHDGRTDEAALARFLESHQVSPRWWMPRLA